MGITVLAIVGIVAGYLVWYRPSAVVPVEPRAESFAPDTAAWHTYRNEKYGYSFRYPEDFVVYASMDEVKEEIISPLADSDKVFITKDQALLFCCEAIVGSITAIPGLVEGQNWRKYADIPEYRIKSQGERMFAGWQAFEVQALPGIDSAGARLILIPSNSVSLLLLQGDEDSTWTAIIDSFKFD